VLRSWDQLVHMHDALLHDFVARFSRALQQASHLRVHHNNLWFFYLIFRCHIHIEIQK
jgi:hypothetical protein